MKHLDNLFVSQLSIWGITELTYRLFEDQMDNILSILIRTFPHLNISDIGQSLAVDGILQAQSRLHM